MGWERTSDKGYNFTILYNGREYRYKIRLYSVGGATQWYQLFARSRVLFLKLDHSLNLSEEIVHTQTPAPKDFLKAVELIFREIFKQD